MKSIKIFGISLLMASLFLITSCHKESAEKQLLKAPKLPPEASFVMDYDNFSDKEATEGEGFVKFGYANFGYAALNIAFWNGVLAVNLAVPVAAFSESFKHEPEYLGNMEWVWSYEVGVNEQQYQANLHGKVINSDVEWKMFVSKEGEFTDFLWYEGIMDTTYQEVEWFIYQSPANPSLFLTVNYLNDEVSGKQSIRYTKAEEVTGTEASYIEHGNLEGVDMDRYYTIYLQDKDKLTEIEWNYANGNGHVKDEVHFQDVAWHCWDKQRKDVDCD